MAKIEPLPMERTVTTGAIKVFGHGGEVEQKTITDYNTYYSTRVEIAKINAAKEVQLAQIDADTKKAEIKVFKEIELAKVTYQNNSAQSSVSTVRNNGCNGHNGRYRRSNRGYEEGMESARVTRSDLDTVFLQIEESLKLP